MHTKMLRRLVTMGLWIIMTIPTCYADSVVFTQLSSLKNQPAIDVVNLVSLETVDGIENIGATPTNITIQKPGFYFLLAAGQAGPVSAATIDGNQYVDIWLIRNGVPVPNSTARITVGQFITGTVITQNLIPLNENDKLSIGFAASAPSYGLVATPKRGNVPAIPSLIFTLYKIQ